MAKQKTKTVYLHGDKETSKDGERRDKKIIKLAKKLNTTQSGAVREMIDAYQE
jgi:hypothetical protein